MEIEGLELLLGLKKKQEEPEKQWYAPGVPYEAPPPPGYKPVVPETKGTYAAGGKVDSRDIQVDAILPQEPKAPVEAPPQTLEESITPVVPQLSEKSNSWEEYDKLVSQQTTPRREPGLAELIMMAIPTMIGARYGQVGAGAKVAGDFGIKRSFDWEKRQDSLDDMIMKARIAKARSIAMAKDKSDTKLYEADLGDGKPTFVDRSNAINRHAYKSSKDAGNAFETEPYLAPDNKTRLGTFNKQQGKWKPFSLDDPEAPSSARDKYSEAREKQLQYQREKEQRDIILKTRDKLNQDIDFKKQRVRLSAVTDAKNILNQANPIGDAGVTNIFSRGIFGNVGDLTDSEREPFQNSQALNRKFQAMLNKYQTGKLGWADRKDLLDLATAMENQATKRAQEIARSYTDGVQSLGIDATKVINPLLRNTKVSATSQDPTRPPGVDPKEKDADNMTLQELEEYAKKYGIK